MADSQTHPLVWSYPLYVQERGIVVDWTRPYPTSVVTVGGEAIFTGTWEECCKLSEDMVKRG